MGTIPDFYADRMREQEADPTSPITLFRGQYHWLSNMTPVVILYHDIAYASVEHAYMASRCLHPSDQLLVASAPDGGRAKRLAKGLPRRSDWEEIKLSVMQDLLRLKFTQDPFKTALLQTGTRELIEGNWWRDTFWGSCFGRGETHLGRLLMNIRSELRGSI